jgi:aromatic ring-opening dioxygenase catalytic subunit (LigB family)
VRLGEVLARAVARSDRRVLLIASGGMSHKFWDLAVIRDRASANPRDINGDERRRFDERIMALWYTGDHAAVLALAEEFRRTCSPEGRFAHYLILAGAFARGAALGPGTQYGRYKAAIGTGQSIFWFDPLPIPA